MAMFMQAFVTLLISPVFFMLGTFCLEIVFGLRRPKPTLRSDALVDTCILIPAHNEEAVIGKALGRIIESAGEHARILVVADNCNDGTAQIARSLGVEVVERFDQERRGKGFALAFGIDHLTPNPPEVLVLVDADCRPEAQAMSVLANAAMVSQRPVQGCYLLDVGCGSGPKTRISAFAFLVKNQVRQNGMGNIADTCVLTGSGMAFPWQQIQNVDLANGEAVEDLVLGLKLALLGHYPCFVSDAVILSDAAPSDEETTRQRQRWETGFMTIAARFVPKLIWHAFCTRSFRAFWLALHLTVPPFMLLLATGWLCVFSTGILGQRLIAGTAIQVISFGIVGPATFFVGLAWMRFGRKIVRPEDLLQVPAYTFAKICNVISALTQKNRSWNKTNR